MAQISSSSSLSSGFPPNSDQPSPESIRALVILVNQGILEFIRDGESWSSLKLGCTSRLNVRNQDFFEFSDHTVLSNLYWGIEGVEAAILTSSIEKRASELKNSENKLQFPALLDEQGTTSGIPNAYLVSCSYFYLSIVKCLQFDHSQAALHFLQAVSVSPNLCRTQLAPKLCRDLFGSVESGNQDNGNGKSSELVLYNDPSIASTMRQMAQRYKHWLIYQQVLSCGETAQWHQGQGDVIPPGNGLESPKSVVSSASMETISASTEHQYNRRAFSKYEKVYPLDPLLDITDGVVSKTGREAFKRLDQISEAGPRRELLTGKPKRKCLQDMLKEPQSDTPSQSSFIHFYDEFHLKESMEHFENLMNTGTSILDDSKTVIASQNMDTTCHTCGLECTAIIHPPFLHSFEKGNDRKISRFSYALESGKKTTECVFHAKYAQMLSHYQKPFQEIAPKCWNNSSSQAKHHDLCSGIENSLSKLCFSSGLVEYDEGYALEVAAVYEMLSNKTGGKYVKLNNEILEQLVTTVSTSKEKSVIRASISMLIAIISSNKTVLEDIKKRGLKLSDLAKALKQNVHEAIVLIYLLNPSPAEMRTLELLPALVNIVCCSTSFKASPESRSLTPPVASLMIIEVLVTSFDDAANEMQLAEVSSPHILSGLIDVARNHSLTEFISLATILVRCMQFDGQCRRYISQIIPVAPFICLIQSNEEYAKLIGLEFLHQVICIPRSSAVSLLQQICKLGSVYGGLMDTLMLSSQQLEPEYQVLAAGLLLQLDTLGNSSGKSLFKEAALQILLDSIASEESSNTQLLSASILSNIGGTYAWSGEPYTTAWLVKKAGLVSRHHRNMIRNIDWSDQCLQDAGIDSWSSRIARNIIEVGKPVFISLAEALKSKEEKVSRDALTTIAWLGCEIARSYENLKCSATEALLGELEKFLHPGIELEERLLACFSIYNYASGKGMKKLIHFSEGVWESLRRFSSVTWMAEELHLVADYYLPNKPGGAVTALIFYKGLLCSGYSDGSIKVWDTRRQSATLLWDMKEHKKAVTCFALSEQGDNLLSGSSDKTIRIWQMIQRKLECIEVIATKDQIQQLETHGRRIFLVSQGNQMKVLDSSRKASSFCKSKRVKCMKLVHGKMYIGCIDSSMQEVSVRSNNPREIKAPEKSWRMQSKPINSIAVYKNWMYGASSVVQGSTIKEWRRQSQPQMSMMPGKGASVLAMEVTEDFIYLNCSSSTNNLQIWLRGTQQKVGRITAGSRITSLLTANDTVLCGTETGMIKGWIPL